MKKWKSALVSCALIAALSVTFCASAAAQSSQSGNLNFTNDKWLIAAGIVVVAAVVVTVVLLHRSSGGRTIMGCVSPATIRPALRNDRDGRLYTLAGDTAGVKPAERMTLRVKKIKTREGGGEEWELKGVNKDFGACAP